MRYRVLDTTDNKYENTEIDIDRPSVGDVFHFHEIEMKVDKMVETHTQLHLVSSNYIIILQKL